MDRENTEQIKEKWKDRFQCPSCDITLKLDEVKSHCELEMNLLKYPCLPENGVNMNKKKKLKTEENSNENTNTWGIFQRIKKNRQSRSETRSRKRSPTETKCPVCKIQISRDASEHIENCLHQQINLQIDEGSEDITEEFEEYEWAGQKRIRVSSLLQGGYASIGIGTVISNTENEDEDLNVDDDDTHIYGPPQYSETDVISSNSIKNDSSNDYNIHNYINRINDSDKCNNSIKEEQTNCKVEEQDSTIQEREITDLKCARQIIDSLKEKLRKWGNNKQNKFKCLICLEEYHNPAISVSCWHVHCEKCWLRSLGARKLCPQCNLITSPSDLRRIYM